ncbi:MAG: hypothetical protein COZ31_01065 [Nitrospirae bacterium CG_4_10_14_3_um_filter_44_29]|nr:hypothetical protein [Nitrospirota bacterium]OIO29645.1 MAG: hypothetical protein AUJ60_04535 [Nitrospirae bacterium CG1_02_44_142]PIV43945.1 MAG: hypothetical protein COS28_01360 [Nitrospirae bacterium CG02_land_8_20_14_3_00_44_33]PIV67047.1 MAG: hypothetical protein COS10_03105 [Nitrospirae bacterium CG01_land_8_20_14_3_00_44_22]PIW89061.1 MAG: hypothetical protein COZ93_07075 [Nitrospirae bacterium CG_4_8_14_3_um_filter_44_28]PIX89624.1 MAG: hypothetical protein COZ31_01065 [Nitrospirae 
MEEQKAIGIDLSIASREMIEALISESGEPSLFEEILKANTLRPDILRLLVESPYAPENIREDAAKILQIPVEVSALLEETEEAAEQRTQTLLQKIQGLSVAEKRMLAMRGGREARSILIKDTNKQIVMAVLDNPKIKEAEVEMFARSRSIPDEALRTITHTKEWMKNYGVLLAVVSNPKTPAGVAIPLLFNLKMRDLAALEKNRNIAEVIRTAAKKIVQARKGR